MGKIPKELRQKIADSIKNLRLLNFPGRGGGKKCAAAFGVSPQQWSPWERGMRTPDEGRLVEIAEFFKTTVEDIRRGIGLENEPPPTEQPPYDHQHTMGLSDLVETSPSIFHLLDKLVYDLTHNHYSRNQTLLIFMFLDGMKMHCLSKAKSSRPPQEPHTPLIPSPDIAHREMEKLLNAAISHTEKPHTPSKRKKPAEYKPVPGAPPISEDKPLPEEPEENPSQDIPNPEEPA